MKNFKGFLPYIIGVFILFITGCDQPGEPVGSLKKPFDFGIKPDSVPNSADQNKPLSPSEEEELSKKDGTTRICILEPGFRGQKTGYFILTKPGRLRAVVTSNYAGEIEAVVKVNLTTYIPTPDHAFYPVTHSYFLKADFPSKAETKPYSNEQFSYGYLQSEPFYEVSCDLEKRDYPIEVQFIEGQ